MSTDTRWVLTWVRERMPETCASALAKFTEINPHWQGAGWDDCLDVLMDSDANLEVTEPLMEASRETPFSARLIEAVALTLLYASEAFANNDTDARLVQVLYQIKLRS